MSASTWKLVLLHTNDSHGHIDSFPIASKQLSSQLRLCESVPYTSLGGYAHLATLVQDIRKKNPYTLLLDSGDMFSDSLDANLATGRLQLSLMNQLGYDAMCPGNHDIDFGDEELKSIAKEAAFPILAANLLEKGTQAPYLGQPFLVKQINGIQIAIYGLTYHLTPETTANKNIEHVVYTFEIKQIQRDISYIRNLGADLVIVLSHLGTEVDEKLTREVKGIDIILGGHTHDPIPLNKVNDVYISQTTPYFSGLGYLELIFSERQLSMINGNILPILPEYLKADKIIKQTIDKYREGYRSLMSKPIGYALTPIVRNYKSESPADNLLGNSIRFFTQSEISILPGVGYGISLPSDMITEKQLNNLFPHQSSIYTCYLKGEDILAAIEQSIFNQINPNVTERVGGLIQSTGLQFIYTFNRTNGSYILSATVNGEPVKPNRYYRTAMNQLMIEGGHKYTSLRNAVRIKKSPYKDIDFLKKWFEHSPVVADIQGWSVPYSRLDKMNVTKRCFPFTPLSSSS